MLNSLTAISPLDGRYRNKVEQIADFFSEYALMRARVKIEILWFIFLCNRLKLSGTRRITAAEVGSLEELYLAFDGVDGERIKEFEKETNHDVKAVEYFIKEHMRAQPKLFELAEFVHFGCTSEDINNLAYAVSLKAFVKELFLPLATGLVATLYEKALLYKAIPMLARTHGQSASPTTLGKELIVYVVRLEREV